MLWTPKIILKNCSYLEIGIKRPISLFSLNFSMALIWFSFGFWGMDCHHFGSHLCFEDPRRRLTLGDVADHSWVKGDDGPIPEYLCWCKRQFLERDDSDGSNILAWFNTHQINYIRLNLFIFIVENTQIFPPVKSIYWIKLWVGIAGGTSGIV